MSSIDYFIDGSCLGNNSDKSDRRTAYALVKAVDGVFVYQDAVRLDPPFPQTNQYAELAAFQRAFHDIRTQHTPHTTVTIYSDSAYAIQCISMWGPTWKSQGWKRKTGSGGKPLEHLDVIRPLVDYWIDNKERIVLKHIAAHQSAAKSVLYPYSGNALADKLAKEMASSLISLISPPSPPSP